MRTRFLAIVAVAFLLVPVAPADGQQQLEIRVTNLQPADGLFFTPVWFGIHDGSFDLFNSGSPASTALEALAEEGIVSGLQSDFAASQTGQLQGVITGPAGFGSGMGQPPVIDPGETATVIVTVPNTVTGRFFSYASMVIPSNDAFIGNGNPLAIQLFDGSGNFTGPVSFDVTGGMFYDSGTEVNDGMGAAFSTNGGTSTTENGVVQLHPGLQNFLGTGTAAGTTINSLPGAGTSTLRFTITAVPEPGVSALLAGMVTCLAAAGRRRRID